MKRSILLLLALFWLCWVGPCSAQSYEVTEAELTRLETIFQKLESCNSELMKDLAASNKDLETQRQKVLQYQADLAVLRTELELLRSEIAKVRLDLATAKSSLERANLSLAAYEKEMKRKVRIARQQRNIAWLAAGCAALWAANK